MDYNLNIYLLVETQRLTNSTENEPELFDRNVPMPRGKISSINSSMRHLNDRWQTECG